MYIQNTCRVDVAYLVCRLVRYSAQVFRLRPECCDRLNVSQLERKKWIDTERQSERFRHTRNRLLIPSTIVFLSEPTRRNSVETKMRKPYKSHKPKTILIFFRISTISHIGHEVMIPISRNSFITISRDEILPQERAFLGYSRDVIQERVMSWHCVCGLWLLRRPLVFRNFQIASLCVCVCVYEYKYREVRPLMSHQIFMLIVRFRYDRRISPV